MSRSSLIVAVALLAACNSVFGVEERFAREDGGGGSVSTLATGGGGAAGCVGAECFPPGPADWTGPLLFAQGPVGEAAVCEGAYATEELYGLGELADPTHSCPCTCAAPTGIGCTVSVKAWHEPTCITLSQTRTFDGPGDCKTFSQDPQGASFPPPAVDLAAASCAASVAPPVIPPVTWMREGRACGPVEGLDGLPPDFEACIFHTGDVACPGQPYSDKTLWFDGVADTRECDVDCSCGPVLNAACNPVIESHRNFACSEEPKITPPEPGCVQGFFDSALLVSVTPSGSCQPSEATASGALTPTGPTTVCCQP